MHAWLELDPSCEKHHADQLILQRELPQADFCLKILQLESLESARTSNYGVMLLKDSEKAAQPTGLISLRLLPTGLRNVHN